MQFRIHLPAFVNHDIFRQENIETMHERLAVGDGLLRIEVSVEVAGMYSCVGTSASCYAYLLSYLQADTFLQFFLDRDSVRLNLPTMITCSIISQMQKISFHNSRFIMHNSKLIIHFILTQKYKKIILLFRKLSFNFVAIKC